MQIGGAGSTMGPNGAVHQVYGQAAATEPRNLTTYCEPCVVQIGGAGFTMGPNGAVHQVYGQAAATTLTF